MQLAFSTLGCPNWSMEQVVAAARQYGYEGLELRLLDGEVIAPDLDQTTRNHVKQLCRAAGLPIICVDTSLKVAQPNAEAQQAQIRDGLAMLELAAAWESPLIRVFGGAPEGANEDAALAGAAACLQALAERGQQLGVAVALETHDVFAAGAKVAQVLAQVPNTNAGALWDTLHPYRVGETADQTLALLGERLLHVHIKDGRRPADGGPNWDLTLLDDGDVPVRDILAQIKAAGYDGWLSIEWEKKWHPEIAEPEIALPQHADLLREYLTS